MNSFIKISIVFMGFYHLAIYAQNDSLKTCSNVFRGHVYEGNSKSPLLGATLYFNTLQKGTATDANGEFTIEALCKGVFTVKISYVGFKTIEVPVEINKNTHLDFYLQTDTSSLESIVVTSQRQEYFTATQPVETIEARELETTRGLSLGESLKLIPGVNSIQTGPSISKPMIHGLHSNRILIINNGVRQEGQQWGSEHAPEIDPFIATKLTVIKGAGSIRYGSDAMGGVVLVEPKPMRTNAGIGGEANLVGMSNGRMGVVSGILEGAFDKKLTGLSWRIQGTEKRAGNFQTAHYYMENTGLKEGNFSGALAYNKEKYGAEIYYSQFETTLGIFAGSEASNRADILAAIARSKPLTPSYFSYKIDRPYQHVSHQLIKANGYIRDKNGDKLEFILARQYNDRIEYGLVPITGSDLPTLYLQLATYTLDVIKNHRLGKTLTGKIGLNGILQNNTQAAGSLNPNFGNTTGGIFIIEKWHKNRWIIETGLRYDYKTIHIEKNEPLKIPEKELYFKNFTGSVGASYSISEHLSLNANASTAWRAPNVSELYAKGIDVSVGFVNGDAKMTSEQAYSFIASLNYSSKWIDFDLGLYNNIINNFIFLNPDRDFTATKSGSFPSFTYTQANVDFKGIDASFIIRPVKNLSLISKTALIFAYNYSIHDYLIQTPANRFDNTIKYELGKLGKLKDVYISLSDLYVAQQTRVPANSDFATPPPAYHLVSADVGFDLPIGKQAIGINLGVTNMLNVSYRDYLNRFRYYTDDLGRNFTIRVKVPFEILKPKNNNSSIK